MSNSSNFPQFSESPISLVIDPATGKPTGETRWSRPWWLWMLNQFNRTGGSVGNNPADTEYSEAMNTRRLPALLIPDNPTKRAPVDLSNKISQLEDALALIQRSHKARLNAKSSAFPALTLIMLYNGVIANIPSGWQLCDGTNGAPDLRDKFVIAAGGTYAVGATGGSTTISTANLPSHDHTDSVTSINVTTGTVQSGVGATVVTNVTSSSGNTGATGSGTNYLQPYYAEAYIINTSVINFISSIELDS